MTNYINGSCVTRAAPHVPGETDRRVEISLQSTKSKLRIMRAAARRRRMVISELIDHLLVEAIAADEAAAPYSPEELDPPPGEIRFALS